MLNYECRVQIKKNVEYGGVYMWRGSVIEDSSSDSFNDPRSKKVKLHHDTESILGDKVPQKVGDSDDHEGESDEDDDYDEEENAREYDFDEIKNEIAYITGHLYDRDVLDDIQYFAEAVDDLALMTTTTLFESDGTCRGFLRNVSSKANKGGFLHIEVGELHGSTDGSRGSPDHQALLLQYVLRYFTDSSCDRRLQITGTDEAIMLPKSCFVTLAAGRAPKPIENPDDSLLFRRFQFTQAGAREQRAEFWYLDCIDESFHTLSLEDARNVNVLYEPDESSHVLGTEAKEMLITLKNLVLSGESSQIEPILELIKNRGKEMYYKPFLKFIYIYSVGWTTEQVKNYGNEARLIHHMCENVAVENKSNKQLLIDLVNLGLDPTLPDLDGNTPLHIAAKFKKVEVFKDLIFITSGFMSLISLPSELWYKIIFQVC